MTLALSSDDLRLLTVHGQPVRSGLLDFGGSFAVPARLLIDLLRDGDDEDSTPEFRAWLQRARARHGIT